jgi:UDP-N-acetylmuramate dehydrogenase
VIFGGKKSGSKDILSAIRERIKQKKACQPTDSKNAGCFFKNPGRTGKTAGELVDLCGFKGFCYGGARVSKKHANFIENFSNASSKDMHVLSKIIMEEVRIKHGIELGYEVNMVGIDE